MARHPTPAGMCRPGSNASSRSVFHMKGDSMGPVVMSWILAAVCVSSAWAVEPANRQSNPQVKAVLEYFYSLSGKADNRIVSGQFTDFGNGSNLRIMERIHEATGQWPALLGADYADFRRGSITTKVPNAAAIEYWRAGRTGEHHGPHVQPGQSPGRRPA